MASRFWVGGTGNWSDATNHWATVTNGAPGAGNLPTSADICTFDGSSGAGTCTLDVDITVAGLTTTAYTGTLTVGAHNVTLTGSTGFLDSASGVHTINMGSQTWTLSSTAASTIWTASGANLTLNAQTSTILINGVAPAQSRTFSGSARTYNNLTIQGGMVTFSAALFTFNTLTLIAPAYISLANTVMLNVATLTDSGASNSAPNMVLNSNYATPGTTTGFNLTNASTLHWAALRGVTITGGPLTVLNSFDLGGNSGAFVGSGPTTLSRARVFTGM